MGFSLQGNAAFSEIEELIFFLLAEVSDCHENALLQAKNNHSVAGKRDIQKKLNNNELNAANGNWFGAHGDKQTSKSYFSLAGITHFLIKS